ncbi:hypothetical protein [Maritimibacter alkaliphilus]|jgi:hypothetical protein|uniref:hypothetical protein n=1 Tax=Maritimibacter alkaliphilus TaxID=404236 RepID=UPI001C95B828|nr:hypothetical protein [Maritimibacter alkaliphilus]MBY6091017.1 hypothetical protein [Maritimibacter alkaliphilus]
MSNEAHLFEKAPETDAHVSIAPPEAPLVMPRQQLEGAPVRAPGFLARLMHFGGRAAQG